MTSGQKKCPQCEEVTDMHSTICPRCKRQFRTQFPTDTQRTVFLPSLAQCPACGNQVSADAVFCARCGAALNPGADAARMPQVQKVKLDLGTVSNGDSYLKFLVEVEQNGDGQVIVVASNSDRRRSAHILLLNLKQYEELKQLIRNTDQPIAQLRSSGRLKR